MRFPVERSDFARRGMPRPYEKRREVLTASEDQNSTWWKRLTLKRSDFGLVRTKFLKPTSLKPVEVAVNGAAFAFSVSFPIFGGEMWREVWKMKFATVCCLL